MSSAALLAVTGLEREARLIARPDIQIVMSGGDGKALETRMRDALAKGSLQVLSIGICGALGPEIEVGDSIVATEIVSNGERFATDRGWTQKLLASAPGARSAPLAGIDTILADPREKTRLYRATNAAAADMESHIAARVARDFGLPFAAFRVVSDSAHRALPPAVLVAMKPDGGVDAAAVMRSLTSKPSQIPALIRTAWEAEKAFRVLFRCRHVLDPALAGVDIR